MNTKLNIGSKFRDLGKSFECVNQNILLSKLELYVMSGKYNS
jgi:hypothetical protein